MKETVTAEAAELQELAHRHLLSMESEMDDGAVMEFTHGLEMVLNLRHISASASKSTVILSISKTWIRNTISRNVRGQGHTD